MTKQKTMCPRTERRESSSGMVSSCESASASSCEGDTGVMQIVCRPPGQGRECVGWFRGLWLRLWRRASDGLVRGLGGGVDGDAGQAPVERMAARVADLGGLGVGEVGAADVLQHAAVEEGWKGGVEEDGEGGGGLLEEEAIGEFFGCAAAEGEDGLGPAEGRGVGGGFEAAEVGFAVVGEEFRDGCAGALLEEGVEIEEGPAEA